MSLRDECIKGIEECELNGGLIGNCPYKYIISLLKEKEIEIEHLKLIIKNADIKLESIKDRIDELLYEDFRR